MVNIIVLLVTVMVEPEVALMVKMLFVVVQDQVHLMVGWVMVLHKQQVDLVQMLIMVLVSLVKVEDIHLVQHTIPEVAVATLEAELDGDAQLLVVQDT